MSEGGSTVSALRNAPRRICASGMSPERQRSMNNLRSSDLRFVTERIQRVRASSKCPSAFGCSRLRGCKLLARLVGVPPHDVAAFGLAALAVTAVALIACVLPARRASRIDPVGAMRVE
jgi:hypothetical protein